jgi:hypothetical protein
MIALFPVDEKKRCFIYLFFLDKKKHVEKRKKNNHEREKYSTKEENKKKRKKIERNVELKKMKIIFFCLLYE